MGLLPGDSSEKRAKTQGDILFNTNAKGDWEHDQTPIAVGTTHSSTLGAYDPHSPGGHANPLGGLDPRDYIYGRDPGAADAEVARTNQIANIGGQYGADAIGAGNFANETGKNLLNQRTGDAAYFNGRSTGGGYAQQLAGLEATPGPSAAQAALAAGTGQAEGSALALARSGRGFGGGAASAGLAQGQLAQLGANYTNSSAQLAAQENAAWRGRQAGNLQSAAGIQLNSQGQNDQAALQSLGLGQQAYAQGVGAQNQGYQTGLGGVGLGLQGQGANNQTRGLEMQGGMGSEDAQLRKWAAENGYNLANRQESDKNTSAAVGAGGTFLSTYLSDIRSKTNIHEDPQAALDFARSLAFDKSSGIYRMPEHGGPAPRAEGFRGASAMPDYAKAQLTPMQQDAAQGGQLPGSEAPQPTGKPGALDSAATHPVSKPVDYESLDDADAKALDAIRQTGGSFYSYKDPNAPGAEPGEKYGGMAQDYAKTPAGRTAVVKGPDGKLGLDTGRVSLLNSSAISAQQSQLDQILARLKSFEGQPGAEYPSH